MALQPLPALSCHRGPACEEKSPGQGAQGRAVSQGPRARVPRAMHPSSRGHVRTAPTPHPAVWRAHQGKRPPSNTEFPAWDTLAFRLSATPFPRATPSPPHSPEVIGNPGQVLLEGRGGRPFPVPARKHVDGFRDLEETALSGLCSTPAGVPGPEGRSPTPARPQHGLAAGQAFCSNHFPKHSLLPGCSPALGKVGMGQGTCAKEGGGRQQGKDRVTHRGDGSPAS